MENDLRKCEIMTGNKIKLTINESGDYAILECGDFKREGYCITGWNWMDLLKHLGYETEIKEISDEEMENM